MFHLSPKQRILVTGGAGYIGSHTVLSLALTRRFKVVSIDNYHNSFPLALSRIEDIAAAALPSGPSSDDIESAKIDAWTADLTCEDQVRAVFAHYGPAAFWGVIHIAVRHFNSSRRVPRLRSPLVLPPTGIQGSRRVECHSSHLLPGQYWCHYDPFPAHARIWLYTPCILELGHRIRHPTYCTYTRNYKTRREEPLWPFKSHGRDDPQRPLPRSVPLGGTLPEHVP